MLFKTYWSLKFFGLQLQEIENSLSCKVGNILIAYWYYFIELNDCPGYSYFSESLLWETVHQEIIHCKTEDINLAFCSSFIWCVWFCLVILFSFIYIIFLFPFHASQIWLFIFLKCVNRDGRAVFQLLVSFFKMCNDNWESQRI